MFSTFLLNSGCFLSLINSLSPNARRLRTTELFDTFLFTIARKRGRTISTFPTSSVTLPKSRHFTWTGSWGSVVLRRSLAGRSITSRTSVTLHRPTCSRRSLSVQSEVFASSVSLDHSLHLQ